MRAELLLLLAATAAPASARISPETSAAASAVLETELDRTRTIIMTDPRRALAFARRAVALAGALPSSPRARLGAIKAQWLYGEALIGINDLDAATPVVASALAEARLLAPRSKLHGDLLRSRAAIAGASGRVVDALRDLQVAHDVFLRAGEPRARAMTLQDIGTIYWEAGDNERALFYHQQAIDTFGGDPALTLASHNNRAEALRKQKRYPAAAAAYRAGLVEARKLRSPLLQVRILTNYANSEAEAKRFGPAAVAVEQALALASHGEAAGWRSFVFGAAARVAAGYGDHGRAADLLRRVFTGVDPTKTDLFFSEYHQTAADVYEKLGDLSAALAHAKAFQRLEAEANQATASTASQLMAARFDFTNQNLAISRLKQDQLRRDVDTERERSRFRNLLFSGLLAAGSAMLGGLLLGYLAVRRSRDAVAAANDSLTGVNDRLEKALEAKTEFLATTSHEIRTPLNGILGMTQVLLADRGVDRRLRERIEVVHGAGETMKALVDDILDVAKMESGELTIRTGPCDLGRILGDAARLWGGQAQAKGLDLVLDLDAAPRRIVSDGPRLRQIVFNLMSNAIKFTGTGRVSLIAGVEGGPDAGPDGGETLVLRVTDTGIGIPADKLGEIFEAFKQVDGGTTRQFGGTGLGLAICKRLAVAMGGDVSVSSMPGHGTTFTVALPLRREEVDEGAAVSSDRDGALDQARVLLLDRNPRNQGVLRMMLAAEAASVCVSDTAEGAIAALDGPDAATHLIVDAASLRGDGADPRMGLRALARAARAAGAHCTVLLAPETAGMSVAEAMAAGASQLVVKPVGAADLLAALRSLYGDDPDTLVAPSLLGRQAA